MISCESVAFMLITWIWNNLTVVFNGFLFLKWPKTQHVPLFTEEDPTYDDLTEENNSIGMKWLYDKFVLWNFMKFCAENLWNLYVQKLFSRLSRFYGIFQDLLGSFKIFEKWFINLWSYSYWFVTCPI